MGARIRFHRCGRCSRLLIFHGVGIQLFHAAELKEVLRAEKTSSFLEPALLAQT